MKRIGNSKEPTPARMSAIAENLREHFKSHCSITISADAFSSGSNEMNYYIYIACRTSLNKEFNTWPQLISAYRKMMKEEPKDVS